MTHRLAAGMAGAALLGLPATADAAPAITSLKPCYVSAGVDTSTGDPLTEDLVIAGTGFTPNSLVRITVDGNTIATNVQVDGGGNLPAGIKTKAPAQQRGQRKFTVSVAEQQAGGLAVSARTLVTNLNVAARPRRARPAQRITITGRGFTRNQPIWAHYVRGGKVRRTVRLAKGPTGPCGTFKTRRRQFPIKKPKTGRWLLQIDQQQAFAVIPGTAYVKLQIDVRRRR